MSTAGLHHEAMIETDRAIALANKGPEQSPAGRLTFQLKAAREAAQAAPRKPVAP